MCSPLSLDKHVAIWSFTNISFCGSPPPSVCENSVIIRPTVPHLFIIFITDHHNIHKCLRSYSLQISQIEIPIVSHVPLVLEEIHQISMHPQKHYKPKFLCYIYIHNLILTKAYGQFYSNSIRMSTLRRKHLKVYQCFPPYWWSIF